MTRSDGIISSSKIVQPILCFQRSSRNLRNLCSGIVFLLCLASTTSAQAQRAERLYQTGLYAETVEGDLPAAIESYSLALARPALSGHLAARTHLRLGICFRLSGQKEFAERHFRKVLQLYPEDPAAKIAEKYLGSGIRQLALFYPEDTLLYCELSEPHEIIDVLAMSVKDTPFENPVDALLSTYWGEPEGLEVQNPAKLRRGVRVAAALFNEGYLRELRKVRAFAVGVPAQPVFDGSHLSVFLPGDSDFLYGVFQSAVALLPHKKHHSFLIFEWEPDENPLHVAVGDDIVLWGRPRSLVEDAVTRHHERTPSLATHPDFLEASRSRDKSFLYAYASRGWLEALRGTLTEEERRDLDLLRDAFDWKTAHPLSISLARTEDDTLYFRWSNWFSPDNRPPLWSTFHTPVLGDRAGSYLPADTLGYFALRPISIPEKLDRILDTILSLQERMPDQEKKELEQIRKWLGGLTDGSGLTFFEELEEMLIGVRPSTEIFPAPESIYLVLSFRDAERGEKAMRKLITSVLHGILHNAASARFQSSLVNTEGRSIELHYVEAFPGARTGYFKTGDQFFLALDIAELARQLTEEQGARSFDKPPRTNKLLSLFPSRLLGALDTSKVPRELRAIFTPIQTLTLFSRESERGFSVELRIPTITLAIQSLLKSITARKTLSLPPEKRENDEPNHRTQ